MTNRVIHFKRDEWHTRDRLAELLGISVRTLYRRIDEGGIEVEETPKGKRYRLTHRDNTRDGHDDAVPDTAVPDGNFATDGKNVSDELFRLLREQLDQSSALHQNRGRLEAKLESSQKDVGRAVDYVAQLEDELDRITQERGELADQLQEERGRRLELEEHFDQVRAELNVLTDARAKYHLERGRREQAEQKCDDLRTELTHLYRELEKLTHQLDDEQQRRLKLALGSLSLELRRTSQD